jgi:hypothetical protein
LSLQSLPSAVTASAPELHVNAHGFSLHAAVRWRADQRKELEQLCRYVTRPAIANERLQRNRAGQVVLQLKSPYKDGTTHIVMEPLEFMERVPAPAERTTGTPSEDAHALGAPRPAPELTGTIVGFSSSIKKIDNFPGPAI